MDGLTFPADGRLMLPAAASSAPQPELMASHPVVERIYLAARAKTRRVLAVAGCGDGDAHRFLAELLAERSAQSGEAALLLDLSAPLEPEGSRVQWVPGDFRASEAIASDPRGFSRLTARACAKTMMRFRNVAGLAHLLDEDLNQYDLIVVVAGRLDGAGRPAIPAATAVQACESVILTVVSGALAQRELDAELQALGPARTRIVGFVLDDRSVPTIGEELLALSRRLHRPLLRFMSLPLGWLGRRPLLWERA